MSVDASRVDPHSNHIINNTKTNNQSGCQRREPPASTHCKGTAFFYLCKYFYNIFLKFFILIDLNH